MPKDKPVINLQDEYNNTDPSQTSAAPADDGADEQDISVTADQMATMKQLASAQNYADLGKMVADILNGMDSAQPMM